MSYFSDKLVALRKERGMSQQVLADKTGLSRSAIGMYETGKREPDIATLELFAKLFNVDMNTLTTGVSVGDSELNELLETLRSREDMRMLFKLAKDATPEDVRSAVKIIEALRND
ncbi:MAG: helix-turn-helix transcriptional regulator [Eubacteriales bacterium]|nr:helix-turn-helix transcriptional regulator [Eubacteriales bacterium]